MYGTSRHAYYSKVGCVIIKSDASKNQLIYNKKKGNPKVFEAGKNTLKALYKITRGILKF